MKLLIKEIETRLGAQQKKRDEREKQRMEEDDRERRREEEEKNGRRGWRGNMEGRQKEEDALKRRDVSLLTMTDVRQLRKRRISRMTKSNTRYSDLSRDQMRRKGVYSQNAVL